MGLKTIAEGVDSLVPQMRADGVQIVFDATSAYVHRENSCEVNAEGAMMVALTPRPLPRLQR
jgi:acetaldehyde/propanal dehydrogenase